jgi:hypothetical protein
LVLGFLHGVQGEFSDDVSEATVGPTFTGHESEHKKKDATHSGSRNVVGKFASHNVQKP